MSESARKDTPEQAEFRRYCREWLKDNRPGDPPVRLPISPIEIMTPAQMDYLQAWQKSAYDAGLVGCDYPAEVGGGGRSDCQRVANEEMLAARTPYFPNIIGLGMAAPTVFYHGTDALKQKLLPRLLSGEDIWCQGFSEPGAGSDLASVQTFAEQRGDKWVINGHKVWTSLAHFAEWMILLLRTDKSHKYDGLSYFLAPMDVPGIDTRPIRKITGEYGFTETFFTDARIPADCLMGEEGQGWKIAMQTLQYERGAEAGAAGGLMMVRVTVDDMIEQIRDVQRDGEPVLQDPVMRDQLVKMIMEEKALALGDKRAHIAPLTTDYPHSLPLSHKLRGTEMARRMRQFAINLQGAAGGLYVGDAAARQGGFWQRAYFNSFSATIGGGTSQVQANIVAEHILGLPK